MCRILKCIQEFHASNGLDILKQVAFLRFFPILWSYFCLAPRKHFILQLPWRLDIAPGYWKCHWSAQSLFSALLGANFVLEIAGMVASRGADKWKWSFKFLNSSFRHCFVLALLTPCSAALAGLRSIWTMLKCHLLPADFCYCKQLAACLPQSPRGGMCVHTIHSQKTQSKGGSLTKIYVLVSAL